MLFALLFGLAGCYIDTAPIEKGEVVVIASDYLTPDDSILFEDYTNDHDIRVVIHTISCDSLISALDEALYDSGFDVVMMSSLTDVRRLYSKDMLHAIYETPAGFPGEYISYDYDYFMVGYNPFVVIQTTDTLPVIQELDELKTFEHRRSITDNHSISLLSTFRTRMSRLELYGWAKAWWKNSTYEKPTLKDSVPRYLTLLTDYYDLPDSIRSAFPIYHFPLGSDDRYRFEPISICIVHDAENYKAALGFVEHWTNAGYNALLNEKLHTIPVYEGGALEGSMFPISPEEQENSIQYHLTTERIIHRLK